MELSTIISFGFYLRFFVIIISISLSIRIIGIKNIFFLKKYIHKNFFSFKKLFYWLVAVMSIFYFEYLIPNCNPILLSKVYSEHNILTSILLILLFSVIIYACYDARKSLKKAIEIRQDLVKAQRAKAIAKVGTLMSFASFFIPGGLLVKGTIYAGSRLLNNHIDSQIKKTLSHTIAKNIEIMLLIAGINLTIILLSRYLITGVFI